MAFKISKRALGWIIAAVVAVALFIGFRYWKAKKDALPEGIASGNGRIEAKLVDVSAREPLRVKELYVDEGALVKPGQVLAQLDTVTLEAQLAEANQGVAEAQQRLAVAKATIAKTRSQINLAEIEASRSKKLVEQGAGSQRELDVRSTQVETTKANLEETQATLKTAEQQVEVAKAAAATIQTRINDATLTSPVTGRVLYRLAESGEVLGAGGKALTLVNLEDVYMEIFLPGEEAAALKVGSEGRILIDYNPEQPIPGYVSFVAPESQFTPKQVETKSEREKLMFRVKIQLPKEFVSQYVERIKTGIRGVGYVKYKDSAVWPPTLVAAVTACPQPSATCPPPASKAAMAP
jgi:HlyD family secretion protein